MPISLVKLLKQRLEAHPEEAEQILDAWLGGAKKKDMRAISELLDRIDGKVAETHKIEGELPVNLIFRPAVKHPPIAENEP